MISVGFDARPLIFTRAGIRTYLYNLVRCLARTGDCRLYLFVSSKSNIEWGDISADIYEECIRLPHVSDAWGRFWERFMLPRGVARKHCDVFHGVRFFVPGRLSCPSVATVHDVAFRLFPQFVTPEAFRYFDAAISSSVKNAARIIVPSETTRADLVRFYGVSESKVSVVYNGGGSDFNGVRDIARFEAVKLKLGLKGRYILSVGTIEPRKNYANLLRAFAMMKNADGLSLVIAGGSGWLYGEVFGMIERLGLKGRVLLAGHTDDADLAQLYCNCELFVFPSFYEGFGIPVLEALQSGACVVASNTASIKELFVHCIYPVEPEHPESIAEGMERVLGDHALRDTLISDGKKRAGDFSWERAAHAAVGVYRSVIGKIP